MFVMRFIHSENRLIVGAREYVATCSVRNEINGWREKDEITSSMPVDGVPAPYYPRKFPTGLWKVGKPEYTNNIEFAPVKIPTNATRNVIIYETKNGKYTRPKGIQKDAYYHLHYAEKSNTTLGCIRLSTAKDARDIAEKVISELEKGDVYLEVIAAK